MMEHFSSPFGPSDLARARAVESRRFLDDVLERAKGHRYFAHPFLSSFDGIHPSQELATFVLTSVYQLVSPFTALLCALGGQAPTLRARFALMDNIYEEMGCGDIESAHPSLYLKMLASIGVSEADAESMPVLPAIRRINDHLRQVVELQHFSVACAMLALAEAVIPPTFPVFITVARTAFPHVDMTFFDRHGPRDACHSDDASMLFAMTADSSHFAAVEREVDLALEYRSELFDDWMLAATRSIAASRAFVSERPLRSLSERPPRSRPYSERPRPPSARPRPSSPPPSQQPSVPPSVG